jgi:uncharacterized membrane protein
MVLGLLLLSLLGSFVNIPITNLTRRSPVLTYQKVTFFGVTWHVPQVEIGTRKMLVTVNVGGCLVPLLISLYILLWGIPTVDANPSFTYIKTLFVLSIVTYVVNRSSKIVRGLGIATPAFVPPAITTLSTLFVYWIGTFSSPTQIAYVGGTIGTLVGADLLNIHKFTSLGAPVISIGGAGTFDGIYTTGLTSVLLVLLIM